jgi:hypothetical protein
MVCLYSHIKSKNFEFVRNCHGLPHEDSLAGEVNLIDGKFLHLARDLVFDENERNSESTLRRRIGDRYLSEGQKKDERRQGRKWKGIKADRTHDGLATRSARCQTINLTKTP